MVHMACEQEVYKGFYAYLFQSDDMAHRNSREAECNVLAARDMLTYPLMG